MASAEDPSNAGAALYNEDEDLLDEEDDDDSSDHGEDVYLEADVDVDEDSASSSPATASASVSVVDRPPASVSTAQVTVAVADVPDFRVNQQSQQQQQQQHIPADAITGVTRKPQAIAFPDESRKLFQRLWTDEDEIELLQGFLEYTTQRGPQSSSHHHDTTAFYDQIKDKLQLDFNKNQLVEKLRRLKKKYRNVISKSGSGKDHSFKSPHDQATFEISSKIWGDSVGVNGSVVRAAPTDEARFEDNDPSNSNFVGNQSPIPNNPNGFDGNSKTPRSRKRNRAGAVKVEEKQHAFTSNPQINQPSVGVGVGVVTPVATPLGVGMPASMSNVIEETVRSCLSPFFKELLGNSMNLNGNALYGNRGFGLALSPMPLGFSGVTGGERLVDEKWRKQQILELEVFSKRLELVQDQIKAQLEELRSMGS
ncbi:probable transcription factor At3g04930 [Olea europaea var. sylvestris]|uniref:probable transcription factor At3g04930 n=1 Tax=Olea europaea var. sylvestris TaxID=158386 RepID=UPI000C1D8B26|nr:probable transcription factor At3g04930 [Olea europaea var. sylvestris]